MSDDLTRRLTPTAGRLHRDDLLFAAGRASAPSPRWWKRACGLLVVSQAVCLGLWFVPRPELTPVVVEQPAPIVEPAPSVSSPPDPSSYVALLHTMDGPRTPVTERDSSSRPTLTAGNRRFLD